MTSRPPAVAGTFYPAGATELKAMLQAYLAEADIDAPAPKAMIVPHAGYIYSGPVAAKAYARLKSVRSKIKRVVLLGPTHRVAVKGLATVSVDSFTTPLGDIAIDMEAIQKVASLPQVVVSDMAHAQEHSLEVHLPFLQTCLDDFKLLPFAVGDCRPEETDEVLEALWGGDETLIIISSDLSHFHDYETARKLDSTTSENIVHLDYEKLSYEDACGRNPISGLLHLARRRHYGIDMLDLCNSGDTAGDKNRVVGYGAYVLTQPEPKPGSRYTWSEGKQLVELARSSIAYALEHGRALPVNQGDFPANLCTDRATFVTLNRQGQLRGCIGSLEARRPLVSDISENAYAAAFRDPRFPPLSKQEFEDVDIHISILSPAEPMQFDSEVDLISQLQPGVDGLILEDMGRRGTFLPSVWESLTTPEQFWSELKHKAGLPYNHWSDSLTVHRYHTQYFP